MTPHLTGISTNFKQHDFGQNNRAAANSPFTASGL